VIFYKIFGEVIGTGETNLKILNRCLRSLEENEVALGGALALDGGQV